LIVDGVRTRRAPGAEEPAMTNGELARNVAAELAWDPKVDSVAIDVSADGGVVTLRGTVGSFRQKREARKAAERLHGVVYVDDELAVQIRAGQRRVDADLRRDVLRALMLDILVPDTVDAGVTDGLVVLTGTAERQHPRDEAEFVAGNVRGVVGVQNDIYLTTRAAYAGDVRASITRALERDAKIEARDVAVETINGTAVLTGRVRSWAEHDSAVAAAWAAPGVDKVDDRIEVTYAGTQATTEFGDSSDVALFID
jgi:osmotically-inducible protein OsmY